MNIAELTSDFRIRFFVLIAALVAIFGRTVRRVQDRFNGTVDDALTAFGKAEQRLDRARLIAVREANRIDDGINAMYDAIDAAEDAYDAKIAVAERAARIQSRLTKLIA